jgi:predicted enzyme related to lactoylglutathione lyase
MPKTPDLQKPLVQKVDCIRLSVDDLEAGLAFYRDQLGHTLIWRTEDSAGLRMPDTATEIVLHTEPIPPEIDLKVDSADAAAIRFEQAGGEIVVPSFDIQIGRAVVVKDPWGNQLVLLDCSKGTLITDEDGNIVGNNPPEKI